MVDDRDLWLAQFLEFMDSAQMSISITLVIGGLLISGTPIGPTEFVQLAGSGVIEAADRFNPGLGEAVGRYFAFQSRATENNMAARRERKAILVEERKDDTGAQYDELFQSSLQELLPQYIQLKDVVIVGASPQPVHVPVWRGRLTEIAGWNFGNLP